MCDRTVQFNVLCSMLDAVARCKKPALKRKHLRTFLDHFYTDHEFFSALRLILPGLDKERGTYGLKEAVLGKCIADALGLAKDSEDAKKLLNWKKGNNAGNFPLVAAEVLHRRQSSSSSDLTIKDVNDYLDRLAKAEGRDDKTVILAELINKTNAHEMRWIIMFILKELKLGCSEKTIFHEFHPDAEDLFNVTCDLKLVCEKLKDRSQRYKRQDIVVGKPVRPQLASRVAGVEEVWKKMRGKRIVAECKFDGDRIQIHKNGSEVHFYSRSFIDHTEYTKGMADIIIKQIQIERCILDGEMLVWNKLTNRFAEFGSNQEVAKAARDGLETDQQLCYVAFDILYSGDSSVTHQPLAERQRLLKQVVQPLKGSLEVLLPGSGCGNPDQPLWSVLVHSPEQINKFFLETVENRDEGIVLKDLDSKWEPGDRSGKWVKLKPDYVHAESDLDALIIGCYLGSGRRGGEIGQFLLGLAEKPKHGGHPSRFLSFCKVGSGLSDNERDVLVSKLQPYLRRNDRNTKPPNFYVVTNTAKERPDFWVEQPEKSVILEITSDIRTIKSEVFATPYSLRFPRAHRVRYDKPWYDCLDVESLVQLVHSQSGNTGDVKEYGKQGKSRVVKSRKSAPSVSLVPSHMLVTDVSQVKQETSIFKGLVFHFINVQPQALRDTLHKVVAENGGSFAMNMNGSVTHAVAAERKGMRYQAAASCRDIIHQSWVLDSATLKSMLPLRPKYLLHLSKNSRLQQDENLDEHGDGYFEDLDLDDLKQLFEQFDQPTCSVTFEEICHFKSKYFLRQEGFGQFGGCRVYFHNPIHSSNLDTRMVAEISLQRLELDLLMRDGEVAHALKDATHMIIYASDDHPVSFTDVFRSVAIEDRDYLFCQGLHVVRHSWLEDAIASNNRSEEGPHSLRDMDALLMLDPGNVSTPEKVVVKEHVPIVARKPHKRSSFSMMMVDDRASEEPDTIISKRRLYSAKDVRVTSLTQPTGEKQIHQRISTRKSTRKAVTKTGLPKQDSDSEGRKQGKRGKTITMASVYETPAMDVEMESITNDMIFSDTMIFSESQVLASSRRLGLSSRNEAGINNGEESYGGGQFTLSSQQANTNGKEKTVEDMQCEALCNSIIETCSAFLSDSQDIFDMATSMVNAGAINEDKALKDACNAVLSDSDVRVIPLESTSGNNVTPPNTGGKPDKKKVSYKDLVGKFFGS